MKSREPYEDRADDERQLMALSMMDDFDLTPGQIGDEFGVTRNTASGWLNRIAHADAKMHGLSLKTDRDRDAYHAHRRRERAAADEAAHKRVN